MSSRCAPSSASSIASCAWSAARSSSVCGPRQCLTVRDDEGKKAPVVKQLDRFLCSFDPAEACARAHITVIVVEHAVTIEEHTAGRCRRDGTSSWAYA